MPIIDYRRMAQEAFLAMTQRGLLEGIRPKEVPQYISSYKEWLESYVALLLHQELERLGKAVEFGAVLDFDPAVRDEYLSLALPGYGEFLTSAVKTALRTLTGVVRIST